MKTHRAYQLLPYQPEWKDCFEKAADILRPIFGDNLLQIEHIGSTSIVGMVAKPQVDILVVVKDIVHMKDIYETLQNAGFVPRGRGYVNDDDEYVTKDEADGQRILSIHSLQAGNPKIDEYRIFRNYLQSNDADRELYIQTKQRLFAEHTQNYPEYDSGKKDIIHEINTRAKKWDESQKE